MTLSLLVVENVEVILILRIKVLSLHKGECVRAGDAARVVDEPALVVVVCLHDLTSLLVVREVGLVRARWHDFGAYRVVRSSKHDVAVRYTDSAISCIRLCLQIVVYFVYGSL